MQSESVHSGNSPFSVLRTVCFSLVFVLGSSLASKVVQAEETAAPTFGTDNKPALLATLAAQNEKAIGGTGRTSKAIGGTGRSAKAIGGTGRTSKAIGGTGRTTKAIGGTGRTSKAIGGTGRTTKAIGGTGRTSKAIGGTGRASKAIGGTGRFTKATSGEGTALDTPLLRGAVEAWDTTSRTLQVLGQKFQVLGDDQFAIGAIAVIEGTLDGDGRVVADYAWTDTSAVYVPGSSDVAITGLITKVDLESGRLSVGPLVVDYTQLLWDSAFTPLVGQAISVVGTQAVLNGELQARIGITR